MTEPQLTLGLGPLADVRVTPAAPAPSSPMGPELAPPIWTVFEFGWTAERLAEEARERSAAEGCSLCGGSCVFLSTVVVSSSRPGFPILARCYCGACRQNDERVPSEARIGKGEL